MNTFTHDNGLPTLPIPALSETCASIKHLVAPLVSPETFQRTSALLEEFAKAGGSGEQLGAALRFWRSSLPGNANWLRPLWDDMYLSSRLPLPINFNYFFMLRPEQWGNGKEALPKLVNALTSCCIAISEERYPPEVERNLYLSMDQFKALSTSRIPLHGRDILRKPALSGNLFAAVVCKGQWYYVALTQITGAPLPASALEAAFERIRKDAAKRPPCAPLGAMTTMERDAATNLRGRIMELPANRFSMEAIERSLFVICLEGAAEDEEAFAKSLLGGEAACRWFDKSLQIIASDDGRIGMNFEHAGCDAGVWLHVLKTSHAMMKRQSEEEENNDMQAYYRALMWQMTPELRRSLENAESAYAVAMNDVDLCCRVFSGYTRAFIKQLGCAPDTFLQMAYQVAQYETFGRIHSTYEAVSMREYAEGRTEVARPSSAQAAAFARALHEGAEAAEIRRLYNEAQNEQRNRIAACRAGRGAERHMYGLAAMAAMTEEPLPDIFTDPGWKALKHDRLSTSGVSLHFAKYFGFGAVVEDGVGIGYGSGPQDTSLVITTFKRSGLKAAAFADAVERAVEKMTGAFQAS